MELARAFYPPPNHIRLRYAAPSDLTALMRCCWTGRRREVGRWLLDRARRNREVGRGSSVVVLDKADVPVAYGQLTLWPRCAEISDLIVAAQYRSLGYGTAMVQFLVREAARLGVSCVEIGAAKANPRAVDLYHRLGFEDNRVVMMNLNGNEREPVIYMTLMIPPADELPHL